jgi:hypothetical protein
MIRPFVLGATLVAGLTAGLLAAERATFVLADGSRPSGEIVFHGTGNRNIIDNFLNLSGGPGGRDQTFPMEQVALIDFGIDQPAAAEFQQLPSGDGHLLVLRGGGAQRGTLVNMINGDTVQWRNEAGQMQQFAIHDVSRIYLNPAAARRVYPQLASAAASAQATAAPAAPAATAEEAVPRGAIRVNANQQWVSTGLMVKKGQRIVFAATGQVQFSPEAAHTAGPDGNPGVASPNLPVGNMPVGGLIGKVGGSAPFAIGSSRQPVVMPDSGPLLVGVNDTNVTDNSGSFIVSFARTR